LRFLFRDAGVDARLRIAQRQTAGLTPDGQRYGAIIQWTKWMMAAYAPFTQTAPSTPWKARTGPLGFALPASGLNARSGGSTLRFAGLTGLLAALLALASIGILASLPRLLAGRLIAVLGVFLGLLLLRLLLLVGLILIGHYKSPDRRKKLRYQGNSNCRAQMPCRRAPGGNGWRPRFSTGKSWPLWKKLRKRRQACERYWVMTRAGKPGSVSLAPPSKASIQDDA
jgi:hypothetical protein